MGERGFHYLVIFSSLGCGLMAGVFFAFSSFVMTALGRLPVAEGIAAMQSVNRSVAGSIFLAAFMATALACLVVLGIALSRWGQPGVVWLVVGCALYLVGTFLVTVVWNVPLNNALDAVVTSQADAARFWSDYQAKWGAWNHVRTITSLLALLSLILGVLAAATPEK